MRFTNIRGRKLRPGLSVFACLLAALIISPAQATIMQYLEVEDLTKISSDIFHGQVLSTSVNWNPERTRIYTSVRLRINESFKGSTRRDQIITITQLGGEIDGIRMDYSGRPEFSEGETVVLFAARGRSSDYTVVALKQGKMRVESGEVTRDFSGITLVDRSRDGKTLQPLSIKAARMKFDELRSRISRAQ